MKPALLVIDLQKVYYDWAPSQQDHLNKTIVYINWAIRMFREKGLPVIQVLHVSPQEGIVPGEPGFEMHPNIQLEPSDPVIHKHHGNAFQKTALDELLKGMGVDTLILTGIAAEYCVLATYHGSLNLDYRPLMLKDAVDSLTEGRASFVHDITETLTPGVLKLLLDNL